MGNEYLIQRQHRNPVPALRKCYESRIEFRFHEVVVRVRKVTLFSMSLWKAIRVSKGNCHVETKHLRWIGSLRLTSPAGSLLLLTGLLARNQQGPQEAWGGLWLGTTGWCPAVKRQLHVNKEHSYSPYKCEAFSMPRAQSHDCVSPSLYTSLVKICPLRPEIQVWFARSQMFSGTGSLVAEACNICPFLPSLVLCRCILNYSPCWRITAVFIKGGDNFFWIALHSGRVLPASQDCFEQFMHAAYAKCSAHM